MGYEIGEIWECEWTKMKNESQDVQEFLKSYQKGHIMKRKVTEEEILNYVLSDELFSLLEVDIHVPEQLKQRFEDFPPIFKNCKVSLNRGDKIR